MKIKIITIITFFLIVSFFSLKVSYCNSDIKESNSDNKFIIHKDGIGSAKIGLPYKEFLSYLQYDSLHFNSIYLNGEELLMFGDKSWGKDKIVREITIFSPIFKTTEGIHVGMKIEDFLKIYPDIYLEEAFSFETEYFIIPKYQTNENNPEERIVFSIDVRSNDGNWLGTYKKNESKTKIINKNGYIARIEIYKWKH